MKFIKTFENNKNGWIIRTDEPYFEISLKKIGIPDHIITKWLKNKNIQNYKKLVVFISYNDYSHVPMELIRDFRELRNYTIIEPNENDLEEWKIIQRAIKYNL